MRIFLLLCSAVLLTLSFPVGSPAAEPAAAASNDKVLVVMVYDGGCHLWCDEVRPIINGVTKSYGGKVELHEIDVQKSALKESLGKANELGVKSFVEGALAWVPTVGVFDQKRKLVKSIPGVSKKDTYKRMIEKALKSG
jgi:thiol-disulfide isomerase/thioredoxin